MIRFQKGAPDGAALQYPLAEIPEDDGTSRLASPTTAEPRTPPGWTFEPPAMPEDVEPFARELQEVALVRMDVLAGRWPSWWFERHDIDPTPNGPLTRLVSRGRGLDPREAASLVEMDAPIDLGVALLGWIAGADQRPVHRSASSAHDQFLVHPAGTFTRLGVAVGEALARVFEWKWHVGRPRPEEIGGVGPQYTAYGVGCPCHPAWPAGHGAAAGATFEVLCQEFELDPVGVVGPTLETVEAVCKHWAMYRTLAGVHYANDNLDGFALGVSVVADMYATGRLSPLGVGL